MIVGNEQNSTTKWQECEVNVLNVSINDFFFKFIKFTDHPVAVGNNPSDYSEVMIPFRRGIFEVLRNKE